MVDYNQLDKNSLLPIYYQIAQRIKAYIADTSLAEGDAIPTERELCNGFCVSRMTVRQAVDTLVAEGLLNRQRGRGTFVTAAKISQPLSTLTGFTADCAGRGAVPTNRVVSCQAVPASPQVAEKLGIPLGAKVVQLVRVRCAANEPHAYECSSLLHKVAAPLLGEELSHRSLYRTLKEDFGLKLTRARQSIEARSCRPEVCRLLNIPAYSVVFYIQRVTYDGAGQAVEYVESHYRTDKFRFEVELDLNQ